tara:strand:- start:445 stop:1014 length:570 start_codon:yes stop_codon:yes gene_type:complete
MERILLVGLGNPEPKYLGNRHNIGFMVIDELAREAGIQLSRSKFNGLYGTGHVEGRSVVLLKPQTFMNLSGRSVAPASRFFGVAPDSILVAHDELDLAYGTVRLKVGGGHAGHNGLRSIQAELGTNGFHRLRIGIGRPPKGSVSSFVLSDFSAGEEQDWLPDLIERSVSALRTAVKEGTRPAMNTVNGT